MSVDLEKDRVLRTKRPRRCRSVLFQRSTWAVSPACFFDGLTLPYQPSFIHHPIKNYMMDMDGVIVRGNELIPGAVDFVQRLRVQDIPFLILTNNSQYTPRDLQMRLSYMGLDVPTEAICTSALATAQFLYDQRPEGRAYVIGESGLTTALHDLGYVLTDQDPEYVVLGETTAYSFERITRA